MRIANFAKTRNQITKCEENFNTMKKHGVKLLFAPKLVEKGVWLSIVLSLSQSIPMASFYYLCQCNVSCHHYHKELLSLPQFYQKSGVHFTFFMLILADFTVTLIGYEM
jgi:hypothetical protein